MITCPPLAIQKKVATEPYATRASVNCDFIGWRTERLPIAAPRRRGAAVRCTAGNPQPLRMRRIMPVHVAVRALLGKRGLQRLAAVRTRRGRANCVGFA